MNPSSRWALRPIPAGNRPRYRVRARPLPGSSTSGGPFETAIIERYRRREASVEEAVVEMYLAGVSVRRVEDITEALWGTRVSSGTVSRLNQKIYAHIEAWRNRPIEGEHPYVYLDGIVLKRSWAGEVRNVSLLVAIFSTGMVGNPMALPRPVVKAIRLQPPAARPVSETGS